MTKLSVNINKIALLRNSRGGQIPDLIQFAKDAERFGAEGITVHPRPDQRHIRFDDVYALKEVVQTEFNIEGYPNEHFIELVKKVRPTQVTLVPDPPEALTSSEGWNTIVHEEVLRKVIHGFRSLGIRTAIFLEPDEQMLDGALKTGTDRIEFYTGPYAEQFSKDREYAVSRYAKAADYASSIGLGLNAGHDLNLDNLAWFKQNCRNLMEVSIGHALVRDCLYLGLENVIGLYKRCLEQD